MGLLHSSQCGPMIVIMHQLVQQSRNYGKRVGQLANRGPCRSLRQRGVVLTRVYHKCLMTGLDVVEQSLHARS